MSNETEQEEQARELNTPPDDQQRTTRREATTCSDRAPFQPVEPEGPAGVVESAIFNRGRYNG